VSWDGPVVGSPAVSRTWSVYDFILIWLGGLVGTGVFLVVGAALENENWVIVLSLAGQYVGNLGVFWILTRYKPVDDIGLTIQPGDFFYVALGLVLQVVFAFAFLPLSDLLFPEGRPQQEVANVIAEADTTFLRVALVAAAVVLGPLTEELMYRGVLLVALERRGKLFALLVSSAVFAAVHIPGLDMDRLWASIAVFLPPLFLLGVILAWVTQRTGRLGPAIFLHSGWNLLSAFVLLLPTDVLEQVS
jgi:membrane protease YdiL (CAAX protease family)